jgi:hypothetical protein
MTRLAPGSARQFDPATDPMAPTDYRVQAMVDGLDQVAISMERKWGVGRLRLLVSDYLRARFDEQKDRLDAALQSGEERYIAAQVEGMKRAWQFLDQSATEAGAMPLSPEVWECVLPSTGEVVSLVRTEAEALHIARECRVFTMAEIATLIEGLGDSVLAVKKHFPGATLSGVRRRPPVDWSRGDEIPFG